MKSYLVEIKNYNNDVIRYIDVTFDYDNYNIVNVVRI